MTHVCCRHIKPQSTQTLILTLTLALTLTLSFSWFCIDWDVEPHHSVFLAPIQTVVSEAVAHEAKFRAERPHDAVRQGVEQNPKR